MTILHWGLSFMHCKETYTQNHSFQCTECKFIQLKKILTFVIKHVFQSFWRHKKCKNYRFKSICLVGLLHFILSEVKKRCKFRIDFEYSFDGKLCCCFYQMLFNSTLPMHTKMTWKQARKNSKPKPLSITMMNMKAWSHLVTYLW